eukprot:CAMPEP_0204138228 /NCGR_PEP_ID=MMETSP0361-20130328/17856_1 /ASSEMBLY_ACC=CAM_ASM_000343 /TAXON_ID=268821 /ORGANISM="Scrippsiella Hangoei, Strain SHTV-5" /LENGTH=394 /DNA_ID=CAMNT_0051092009 /DNA_START=22 /DNA_END=1206 /DNA_ORIENTATION=-
MTAVSVLGLLLGVQIFGLALASIRVPIATSMPRQLQLPGFQKEDAFLKPSAPITENGSAAAVPLDVQNLLYHGKIQVGTPGQSISVLFLTSFNYFWVPNVDAGLTGNHSVFDASQSSTHVPLPGRVVLSVGSLGVVTGGLCRDDVSIGSLTLANYTFAEVDNTGLLQRYENAAWDGILGLGVARSKEEVGGPTPMEALVQGGLLDKPIFAFHLGRCSLEDGCLGGELVLGGVEAEHYSGDFTFMNLVRDDSWAIQLDAVTVGGRPLRSSSAELEGAAPGGGVAVVDSGVPLLMGPEEDVTRLARMVGAASVNGLYVVRCDKELPSLVFSAGGRDFSFNAEDLRVLRRGDWCVLGVQSLGFQSDAWVLGLAFMRKYYVQFDWGARRIGVAEGKQA